MSEMTRRVLVAVAEEKSASELTYHDRGRLVAVETPSAVYVGVLTSLIFHTHGDIHLYFQRDESSSDCKVSPETLVAFAAMGLEA